MSFSLKCSVSKILALVANLKFKIKFVYVCMYVTFSRARAYIFNPRLQWVPYGRYNDFF